MYRWFTTLKYLVYEGCKSPEMIVASIISIEEIAEIGTMQYVLPSFSPPEIE